MALHYAKSTNGFYHDDIHEVIPEDAVEITPEHHQSLMDAQATGKVIKSDENGHPVAVEREIGEAEGRLMLAGEARAALAASDVTVIRRMEEGKPLPAEWAAYRKALRGVIAGDGAMPVKPTYPE